MRVLAEGAMSFDQPWWTAGMGLAWLRTADRDDVEKIEAAPQVGSLSLTIRSAFALERGRRWVHQTHEAAMADLRGKLASGELGLYRDSSSGELEKEDPNDAAVLEVNKETLNARIPGKGGWSDRYRFRHDEFLRLWRPEGPVDRAVTANADGSTAPASAASMGPPQVPSRPDITAGMALFDSGAAKGEADLSTEEIASATYSYIL
jgi:hypothetical protein